VVLAAAVSPTLRNRCSHPLRSRRSCQNLGKLDDRRILSRVRATATKRSFESEVGQQLYTTSRREHVVPVGYGNYGTKTQYSDRSHVHSRASPITSETQRRPRPACSPTPQLFSDFLTSPARCTTIGSISPGEIPLRNCAQLFRPDEGGIRGWSTALRSTCRGCTQVCLHILVRSPRAGQGRRQHPYFRPIPLFGKRRRSMVGGT